MSNAEPKPLALRVRSSEARKVQAGGRRLPGGVLSADAADALAIIEKETGMSATASIADALIRRARTITKRKGK